MPAPELVDNTVYDVLRHPVAAAVLFGMATALINAERQEGYLPRPEVNSLWEIKFTIR